MVTYKFGEKLRQVRERKGITLKAVARAIGASESLISQIERNKVSPSIDTLMSIAETLEIDLEYLFRQYKQDKEVFLCRKEEGNSLVLEDISYYQLSPAPSEGDASPFEILLLEIQPGGSRGDTEYGHQGKEFGFLIRGKGRLVYGTKTYDLGEGDSITFSSSIPHSLINTGEDTLQAVWVITPPKIF